MIYWWLGSSAEARNANEATHQTQSLAFEHITDFMKIPFLADEQVSVDVQEVQSYYHGNNKQLNARH